MKRSVRVAKIIVMACVQTILVVGLLSMTFRTTLFYAFVPLFILCIISQLRSDRWVPAPYALILLINVLLAAIPVDMTFTRQRMKGVHIVPILWGLPSNEGIDLITQGKYWPAGCIVPPYPAQYMLVVGL